MTFDDVATLVAGWPGIEPGTYYGTPAFKVGGKAITRLREDGETLVLFDVPQDEREVLVEAQPEVFFFTDHYRDWPVVLCRLANATPDHVRPYLERSWRARCSKRLLKSLTPPPAPPDA